MTHLINPVIDHREYERHHAAARHYINGLRERGLLVEIGNILVDGEQLFLRTFQCNTSYCVKCAGSADAKTYKGSCCTDLVVDITTDEKEKLRELAGLARERLEFAPGDPVASIVDNILAGRVSEVNENHEEVFLHKKDGACAMSWNEAVTGQLRCSINTLCMRMDLPIDLYKPTPCYLFPLHYCEFDPLRIIVTLLTEETRYWVRQHVSVGRLKCLRRPEKDAPPAYQALRGEIEHLFDKEFYLELDRRAKPILRKHSITL